MGDERGESYEFFTRPRKGFLLSYRNKGSVSGNHWHEGKSGAKNPEILLLTSGEIKLYAKDLDTGDEQIQNLKAPAVIEICPRLLHTLTAVSDCAFLEFNSLEEHKADTNYP